MTDDYVAALLDSSKPLVVVEAPAGCGKTFQGASYARRTASKLDRGRALILTHTHSACGQFAKETRTTANKVEIKTIDALVTQIATIYHKALDLPSEPAAWARRQDRGFDELGVRVARLLSHKKMICSAIADRYPIIVADEHQDTRKEQHEIIMQLHAAGSALRVFGDPVQLIYESKAKEIAKSRARWDSLKTAGAFAELESPHRWRGESSELGQWILQARGTLRGGGTIDLSGSLPRGLRILYADNVAPSHHIYQPGNGERTAIDQAIAQASTMLVLTGQNDGVNALRAFWGRRYPVWEGHTREPLGALVSAITTHAGDAEKISEAAVAFIQHVCVGFSPSGYAKRFVAEIVLGCSKQTTGKPALIQELARCIHAAPDHAGVSRCLKRLIELVDGKASGFEDVHIDYRNEMCDAIRIGEFEDAEKGLAELHRRRTYARPMPPPRTISTIHKAKGLECDNAMIIACDARQFSKTDYARSKLYVALSRAKRSLTLVVSPASPSPLFRISGS